MTDERKAEVLRHLGEGKGPREIARLTGVPLGTCGRWCAEAKRAREAAESQARADAAFAANPAPLRVVPGGARADEPAETQGEWAARVLLDLRRQYGNAVTAVCLPKLLRILNDDATPAGVVVSAAKEVREGFAMSEAMCRGAAISAATHIDAEPDWMREMREQDEAASEPAQQAAGGAA